MTETRSITRAVIFKWMGNVLYYYTKEDFAPDDADDCLIIKCNFIIASDGFVSIGLDSGRTEDYKLIEYRVINETVLEESLLPF